MITNRHILFWAFGLSLLFVPAPAKALVNLPIFNATFTTCEAGQGNRVTGVCTQTEGPLSSAVTFTGSYEETTPNTISNANIILSFTDSAYQLLETVAGDPFASQALLSSPTPYTIRFDTWRVTGPGIGFFFTQNYSNPTLPFTIGGGNQGVANTGAYSYLRIGFSGNLTNGTAVLNTAEFCYAGSNPSTSANQCGNSANAGVGSVALRGVGNNVTEIPGNLSLLALAPLGCIIKLRKRFALAFLGVIN